MSDMSFELNITVDDENVLRRAMTESITGWHPAYYFDVTNFIYFFGKLLNAGLLEKHPTKEQYRITQLGRDTVAALDKAKEKLPSSHPEMLKETIDKADEPAPVVPQFLMDMSLEERQQFVKLYNQTPSQEEKLRAQIADLKKQLRDVSNERDIRGAILEQLVGIRTELIDDHSNSWIDSIEKIRAQIIDGREFHNQVQIVEREVERLKAEKKADDKRFTETLDMIWDIVKPHDEVSAMSWEYPAQVVRHVEYVIEDLKKKIPQPATVTSQDGVEQDPLE